MPHADDPRDFRAWVEKAEEDFLTASVMAAGHLARAPHVICFHAQQSCEKFLKAFLAQHQIQFPKTHDLSALLDLAAGQDAGVLPLKSAIRLLTPYAVEFRYPGAIASEEDARRALAHARQVREAIRARLGLPPAASV